MTAKEYWSIWFHEHIERTDMLNPIQLALEFAEAYHAAASKSEGSDPLCKCGHRHLGAEVCLYCDCNKNQG